MDARKSSDGKIPTAISRENHMTMSFIAYERKLEDNKKLLGYWCNNGVIMISVHRDGSRFADTAVFVLPTELRDIVAAIKKEPQDGEVFKTAELLRPSLIPYMAVISAALSGKTVTIKETHASESRLLPGSESSVCVDCDDLEPMLEACVGFMKDYMSTCKIKPLMGATANEWQMEEFKEK